MHGVLRIVWALMGGGAQCIDDDIMHTTMTYDVGLKWHGLHRLKSLEGLLSDILFVDSFLVR